MPTILRIGSYRFFFYSNEAGEPTHIHVQKDDCLAKFWLEPISIANSYKFSSVELSKIMTIIKEHKQKFIEAWNEFFGA